MDNQQSNRIPAISLEYLSPTKLSVSGLVRLSIGLSANAVSMGIGCFVVAAAYDGYTHRATAGWAKLGLFLVGICAIVLQLILYAVSLALVIANNPLRRNRWLRYVFRVTQLVGIITTVLTLIIAKYFW